MTVYGGPPGRSGRPPRRATPRRPRWVPWASAGGGVVAVAVIITLVFTLSRPASSTNDVAFVPGPSATPTASPSPSAAPSASASPTPAPHTSSAATHKAVPTAAPTQPPPTQELPPAPDPAPTSDPGCSPSYSGPGASHDQVNAALVTAAGTDFWEGVVPPVDANKKPIDLPSMALPADLVKAIAWQESGWQSTIVACDGGRGTMQLMANTVAQVKQRFGITADPDTLTGNVTIGTAYLEWLLAYFGSYYFGETYNVADVTANVPLGPDCDPDPTSPACEQMALADLVIAAYNVGPAALEDPDGIHLQVPNWNYVNAVERWWSQKPWLSAATASPAA